MGKRVSKLVVVGAAMLGLMGLGAGDAAAVDAGTVAQGSATIVGDAGDFITGSGTYLFATPVTRFSTQTYGAGHNSDVRITMQRTPTEYWDIVFAAPQSEDLHVGTYTGAVRDAARPPGTPGLSVSGQGRGCNVLSGGFTILDVQFGPFGYVERLHATFEQHCENAVAALRGEVSISNPPAPPAASARVTLDPTAKLVSGGRAAVTGTITCAGQFSFGRTILVQVAQTTKKGTVSGSNAVLVPDGCSQAPTPFVVNVAPDAYTGRFTNGVATVTETTQLYDDYYGTWIYPAPVTRSVTLKES